MRNPDKKINAEKPRHKRRFAVIDEDALRDTRPTLTKTLSFLTCRSTGTRTRHAWIAWSKIPKISEFRFVYENEKIIQKQKLSFELEKKRL